MPAIPNLYDNEVVLSRNEAGAGLGECLLPDIPWPTNTVYISHPLVALALLYLFGPPLIKWRFPCRTPEALRTRIEKLEALVNANSLRNDRLGPAADEFKASLHRLDRRVRELEIRPQPTRANPISWMSFRWTLLRDVDVEYESSRDLEQRINEAIYIAHTAV
ncbi:hypothetical protein VNI00_013302 [Paramarasmius palmivorus]|uniref:Uncharacterized protein n=1 Tax=Paramarasmius palmivorus TaxID=297713 RepID=A0AAW0C2D4_9AGAR